MQRGQYFIILSSLAINANKQLKARDFVPKDQKDLNPLGGVKQDEQTVINYYSKFEGYHYRGTLQLGFNLLQKFSKEEILSKISILFNDTTYLDTILYYSGHGATDGSIVVQTNSLLKYSKIYPEEIFNLWRYRNKKKQMDMLPQLKMFLPAKQQSSLILYLDCCYSGKWVDIANQLQWIKQNITVHAACSSNQTAQDWGSKYGGAFTYSIMNYKGCYCFYTPQFKSQCKLKQNPTSTAKDRFQILQKYYWNQKITKAIRNELWKDQ